MPSKPTILYGAGEEMIMDNHDYSNVDTSLPVQMYTNIIQSPLATITLLSNRSQYIVGEK